MAARKTTKRKPVEFATASGLRGLRARVQGMEEDQNIRDAVTRDQLLAINERITWLGDLVTAHLRPARRPWWRRLF